MSRNQVIIAFLSFTSVLLFFTNMGPVNSKKLESWEHSGEYNKIIKKIKKNKYKEMGNLIMQNHLVNVANKVSHLVEAKDCADLKAEIPDLISGEYLFKPDPKSAKWIVKECQGQSFAQLAAVSKKGSKKKAKYKKSKKRARDDDDDDDRRRRRKKQRRSRDDDD